MNITKLNIQSHEQVYQVVEEQVGLTGLIALHSTQLGPAAGGLRMRPYAALDDALTDVLRLSEGMTYKNAAAGLPLGGGKAVIIGDPHTQKTPELLQSFGAAIDTLQGQYWTAEDMGMSPADMAVLATKTKFVAGLADGDFASGDPSPITAAGIFNAVKTTRRHKMGSADLTDVHVAVQGLGNVGFHLCRLLHNAGAKLSVTDVNAPTIQHAVDEFGAVAVGLDDIYSVAADVFAPCAIGGILTADIVEKLRVTVVAGGANNQLATDEQADQLHARGILYAPDFVANGGGIINVATEILQISDQAPWVAQRLETLDATMDGILSNAAQADVSPHRVALQTVMQSLDAKAA